MIEVSREEFIKIRTQLLKDMDNYLRARVNDENVFDLWLMCGVPDMADEQDFIDIAEDNELWLDAVKTFAKCVALDK